MLNIKKLLEKILSSLVVQTISSSATASTGGYVGSSCRRCGKVVSLSVAFNNPASVASGSNVFVGALSSNVPRPAVFTTGCTYYSSHALAFSLNTSGVLTVRNSSASAVTIPSDTQGTLGITYITNE